MKKSIELRRLLSQNKMIIAPGTTTPLFAKMVEEAGFPAIFVTGAGLANMNFGIPDYNMVTMTENLEIVKRINDNTTVPLIVDLDNGYGSPLNVYRTVKEFSRLDIGGIIIEDQQSPKRCGHFEDQIVISCEDMVQKIKAARYSSVDPNLVIFARTDAIAATGSIDEAIFRGNEYAQAGADVIFVEAPRTIEQMERIAKEIKAYKLINLVEKGKTPMLNNSELEAMGFNIALYANATMKAAMLGHKLLLNHLMEYGTTDNLDNILMITSEERHRITNKDFYKEIQNKYK